MLLRQWGEAHSQRWEGKGHSLLRLRSGQSSRLCTSVTSPQAPSRSLSAAPRRGVPRQLVTSGDANRPRA